MQHRWPDNDEEPSWFAEWIPVKEPLPPDDPAYLERPSRLAELKIVKELWPFSPWDVAEDPFPPPANRRQRCDMTSGRQAR